jgi:hypothetical protein
MSAQVPDRSMRMRTCIVATLVAACSACSPPPATERATVAEAPPATQPTDARPRFVDVDWRVVSSSAVAIGTRYRFAADGSLRIEAEGSTPGIGRWTFEDGKLVMIEEGIAYPTEILRLDAGHFTIRSHNPGTPVDIAMVRGDAR